MIRRILASLACVAGLAGYLITPQLATQASHPAAVHCRAELGHDTGMQRATFERICQP